MKTGQSPLGRERLRLHSPGGMLLTFLFHGVFRDESEIHQQVVDPQQRVTVAHVRRFVEHFLERGFRFVGPDDVPTKMADDERCVMATFDDGYFSNALIRPVLEEFRVPAVFYISTGHVLENRSFWWDVLFRELIRRDTNSRQIAEIAHGLKELTHNRIDETLMAMFGGRAMTPWGDVDRPFTPAELRDFAQSPYVHLGNHTRDHAILTNYSASGIRAQLAGAQEDLRRMVGHAPTSVSYPNGNCSPDIAKAARKLGLTLGITVERRRNLLPLGEDDDMLALGRYTLWGTRDIAAQCDAAIDGTWWQGLWTKLTGRDTRAWQRRSA